MDFATRAQVKLRLEIDAGNTDTDALIDELLLETTGAFLRELSRDPRETIYTLERYNGTGQPRLMLRQHPITAVTFLSVDNIEVPQAAKSVDAGFLFDETELYLSSIIGRSPSVLPGTNFHPISLFSRGFQNILVTYTAGDIVGSPVIRDLANAQVWQVAFEVRRTQRIGESSETLGAGTKSYITDDFLPQVKRALNRNSQGPPVA